MSPYPIMKVYYNRTTVKLASKWTGRASEKLDGMARGLRRLSGYLFVVFAMFLTFSLFKTGMRVKNSENRIKVARMQIEKLKEENQKLSQTLENEGSSYYLEKRIRDELGMVKVGEKIVVLPEEEKLRSVRVFGESAVGGVELKRNWEKWMELFGV